MMNGSTEMKLERFETLADAYGAQIDAWPAEDREAAKALLASNPAARRALEGARELDAMLALSVDLAPSDALLTRVLGDAADVGAALRSEGIGATAAPRDGWFARWFSDLGGWRPAGAMAACLAIGFVAGNIGGAEVVPLMMPESTDVASVDLAFPDETDDGDLLFFGEALL